MIELGGPRLFRHSCGYLPDRSAITEARFFARMTQGAYLQALEAGYRRFGELFFRPRCLQCNACISLRVLAPEFSFRRRWRRVEAKNRDIRVVIGAPRLDGEAVRLANAFYQHRGPRKGWPPVTYTEESYTSQFLGGPVQALEARYYDGDRLLGIGLFDDLPDGETAVIFHYDQAWAPRSPGSFNVLWLIRRALARGTRHVYLGFFVPGSVSTTYKGLFTPAEVLVEGQWLRLPGEFDPALGGPLPGAMTLRVG
ncbi:MAG: arginyltransferase [Planctomycetota bacterium]